MNSTQETSLPLGWVQTSILMFSACEPNAIVDGPFGSNLRLTDYVADGTVPVLTTKNIDGDYSGLRYISAEKAHELRRSTVRPGDIVMAKIGSCGKCGFYAPDMPPGIIPANLLKISVHPALSPKYLYHYLNSRSFLASLKKITRATAQPAFGVTNFRKLEAAMAPRSEQGRVVDAIESYSSRLDDAVATLKRVQANLKRYRASVLKAAVEGRLVPTEAELAKAEGRDYEPASVLLERILAERRRRWEEAELAKMEAKGKPPKNDKWKAKYKEPAAADSSGLPELPEGWVWATLDQVCPVFVDCAHRTPKYSHVGIPALRPRDVVGGRLALDRAAVVPEPEYEIQTSRRVPVAGDLIYSRELSLGWAVEVPVNTRVCMSQGMVLFRPGTGLLSRYILQVLNGPFGRRQATQAATGSAHPHLNLRDIRGYLIPLPPMAEQERVAVEAERLTTASDRLAVAAADSAARCGALRQSILKWAFEGKLVDQDPTDEPASVLLERIKAEREAATVRKRPRKRTARKKKARS